jgi:hypothetical protein
MRSCPSPSTAADTPGSGVPTLPGRRSPYAVARKRHSPPPGLGNERGGGRGPALGSRWALRSVRGRAAGAHAWEQQPRTRQRDGGSCRPRVHVPGTGWRAPCRSQSCRTARAGSCRSPPATCPPSQELGRPVQDRRSALPPGSGQALRPAARFRTGAPPCRPHAPIKGWRELPTLPLRPSPTTPHPPHASSAPLLLLLGVSCQPSRPLTGS